MPCLSVHETAALAESGGSVTGTVRFVQAAHTPGQVPMLLDNAVRTAP
jgi:hypothetical protein